MANPAIVKLAPNVIQVAINSLWRGVTPITTVQHWQFGQAADGTSCAEVANGAIMQFQRHLSAMLHADLTYQNAHWMLLTSATSPTGTVGLAVGEPTGGAKVGFSLPPNCALLVHKQLSTASRSARNGRMFLVGIEESKVDALGTVDAPTVTAAQTQVDLYFANAATLTSSTGAALMCQPHWTKTNRPPLESGGLWPATSVSGVSQLRVQPRIATQRRRLR